MRRTVVAAFASALLPAALAAPLDLSRVSAGDKAHGFRVESIYLDAADRPLGARFLHQATGFTLDLLQIESVPQSFSWVNTFATSDQGEPHTQEHLLLLRGKRGRTLATRQSMSLVTHSAFTQTWRTSYFFNTAAGTDVFFDVFAEQQRAMLHPDYSDAEIRLEVRNFGVTRNADGSLRLEEKGTVYNEMVASMANATWKQWRAFNHAVYGTRHPLGYNQGGEPSGIRTMTPEDIRKFHRASHHLANMGTIAAFPKSDPVDGLLARFDRILSKDAPRAGKPRAADSLEKLPPPAGDPEGAIRIYEYPHRNEQQPSPMSLAWPANRALDAGDLLLAELFFANLAGDATTNLYRMFIDSRTRKLELGARSVSSNVGDWGGHPITIAFNDVSPAKMSDEGLKAVRALVMQEIDRIAALPDGSTELRQFNERVASRVVEAERQLVKFIGTPPGFGARAGAGSQWMDHLLRLEKSPGARKSLTMKPEIARVKALLAGDRNFWREHLARWKVTGTTPYIVGARPSPSLIAREETERKARLDEQTEHLKVKYKVADAQEALKRHAADSDAEFARIEAATKVAPLPFVKSPPLTLDDGLKYEATRLPGGVPLVASRFDTMTGATTGVALRVDGVPREELRYLSLLPQLLATVGVIDGARPVPYEEMRERLRREILGLTASFSANPRTGRVELVLKGSGVGVDESRRAIDWMQLVLQSPDWRPENLARIRDVVDQQLAALRNTVQRPEEAWVNDPANAYRMQRSPAWLASESFLTRTHNALRLRWLLKERAPEDAEPLAGFFTRLAQDGRSLDRAKLKAYLADPKAAGLDALSASQRAVATDALRDLDLTLGEIPDASVGDDFSYLALAMRDDLGTPPSEALARMHSLRKRLLRASGARMFLASSAEIRTAIAPRVEALAGLLERGDFVAQTQSGDPHVVSRLRMRDPSAAPVHVGLHAPNKQGGVIITSVPAVHFSDAADTTKQLDFLASRLYGGGGSHGVFSKTVGAGLAYSNGLRGAVSGARMGYYAERTPELPQTVRFVVDIVKNSPPDRSLTEYVMAQAFLESRASQPYESRAEGIANDIADGQTPEQVRRFRESILALRKDNQLIDKLYARKDEVHARMIPGYSGKPLDAASGTFMVIGPDKQLDAWEQYLKAAEGAGAKLYRLYGRDFWMP
jgi:Zn-dependent M16 (insulinase) family peptidase